MSKQYIISFRLSKDVISNFTAVPIPTPIPTPIIVPGVKISFVKNSEWGTGYNGTISIKSPQDLANWKLECNTSQNITWASNVSYTFTNGILTILPLNWFQKVSANQEINFTFGGITDLTNFVLTPQDPMSVPNTVNLVKESIVLSTDTESKRQLVIKNNSTFKITSEIPITSAFSNNTSVFNVSFSDKNIFITTNSKNGRGCLKINNERIIGIVVGTGIDTTEVPISMVSEDDPATSLAFWKDFEKNNKRCEGRYVYLNGGPGDYGWRLNYTSQEYNLEPLGKRAVNFIRNSLCLGMVPTFVYYNIPDGGESYTTNLEHLESNIYMEKYFKDLEFLLDTINIENPNDLTRIIFEPDAIGYFMQNSGKQPSEIMCKTSSVYTSKVLNNSDIQFPDTLNGLIQCINYLVHKKCSQVEFGWQINCWSNPVSIPGGIGLMRSSDFIKDFNQAKEFIKKTAQDTAIYYRDCGIMSYGANFFSIDKYGLDYSIVSAEKDPRKCAWAFNHDHWNNYLFYIKTMSDVLNSKCVIWQMTVGHLNSSKYVSPYTNELFKDLPNTPGKAEDSATTFFFGDTFIPKPEDFSYWTENKWNDPLLITSGDLITYSSHIKLLEKYNIIHYMVGAGVGISTTSNGNPITGLIPGDDYFCISKIQDNYKN